MTILDNILLPAPIGESNIYISADTNREESHINNVRIENNQVPGNIVVKASSYFLFVLPNFQSSPPGSNVKLCLIIADKLLAG